MVGRDQHMVLNLEQAVPQTVVQPSTSTAFSEIINYTAVIASQTDGRELIILYWGQLLVIN
jgi:hypothetical protein